MTIKFLVLAQSNMMLYKEVATNMKHIIYYVLCRHRQVNLCLASHNVPRSTYKSVQAETKFSTQLHSKCPSHLNLLCLTTSATHGTNSFPAYSAWIFNRVLNIGLTSK